MVSRQKYSRLASVFLKQEIYRFWEYWMTRNDANSQCKWVLICMQIALIFMQLALPFGNKSTITPPSSIGAGFVSLSGFFVYVSWLRRSSNISLEKNRDKLLGNLIYSWKTVFLHLEWKIIHYRCLKNISSLPVLGIIYFI